MVINASACIGCSTCRDVCPFNIPFYDKQTGKAKKCIGCYDRVEAGMKAACVTACPSQALISGPEDDVIAEGDRRVARYAERLGHDYVLYGKDKINRLVGRLGWVSIAASEDAKHYDLFAKPGKATMIARDLFKIGGAAGTAGVAAGATLYGLYLFARRKDQVQAAETKTEEVSDA